MRKLYVGIDNGLSGGIAIVNDIGEIYKRGVMPTIKIGKGRELDVSALAHAIARLHNEHDPFVLLEKPTKHSPGVISLCSTWCCYGGIRAVIEMTNTRLHEITTPRTWQKEFWTVPKMPKGKKFDTKSAALKIARELWPNETWLATSRSSVPHNGLVDAALIAEYGRRKNL